MTPTTNTETMTSRERMLACLRGQEVDRFPVMLKVGSAWWGMQEEPYASMSGEDVAKALGFDAFAGSDLPGESHTPHVTTRREEDGDTIRTIHETPDGVLVSATTFDPASQTRHPSKYPVNNIEEFKAFRWLYRDVEHSVSPEQAEDHTARCSEIEPSDRLSQAAIGPSPLMDLIQHILGPEQAIFMMMDEPELFHEVMDLMHQTTMNRLRTIAPYSKCDTVWLIENTSTSLMSPTMFREICMPHLRERTELLQEYGMIVVHHMCGKLNGILEMIDELPAEANEAFTTPTVGDATLAEGRNRMPSKCLIGGTNAALWLRPAEEIIETVAADVANCPDRRRIFLTSAGQLPPYVTFEKAKTVLDAFRAM